MEVIRSKKRLSFFHSIFMHRLVGKLVSQSVPPLNVNYWIVILGLPFCHRTSHALKNKQCALRKFIHCRVSSASLPFQACSIPWFLQTPHVMKALLEAFSPGPPNLAHIWSPTRVAFEKKNSNMASHSCHLGTINDMIFTMISNLAHLKVPAN